MHFDVTTLDDGRVIHARFARDEIINLAFVTFSFIKAELEITVIVLVITG